MHEIARKNNIGAYYQEKDYLLNIFLNALYREEKNIIFKGGTCLKLVYNYPRFSEDLDFDTTIKPERIKTIVRKVLSAFVFMGIKNELIKEEIFEKSYTAKIKFFGLPETLFLLVFVFVASGRRPAMNTALERPPGDTPVTASKHRW